MLTGLSNLLFGSKKTEINEPNQNSCNKPTKVFRTKEDDDGWIVVSSKEKKDRDDISEFSVDSDEDLDPSFSILNANFGHDYEVANELNTSPHPQIISPVPPSTPSSLSHLDPEGSWYLTPPPCFIAGNTSNTIMSPMENLLIEHPSMSVYQQTSQKSNEENDPPKQEITGSKSLIKIQEAGSSVSGGIQKKNRAKHVNLVNNRAGLIFTEILKQEHDLHQNQELFKNKHICRNQLDRNNKVREFNSVGKRNRRKDRMKNPSGMNNNRKC